MAFLLRRTRLGVRIQESIVWMKFPPKSLSSRGVCRLLPQKRLSSSSTSSVMSQAPTLAVPRSVTPAGDTMSSVSPQILPSLGRGNSILLPPGPQEAVPFGPALPRNAEKTMLGKDFKALDAPPHDPVYPEKKPPPKDSASGHEAKAPALTSSEERVNSSSPARPAATDGDVVAPVATSIDQAETLFWQKVPLWKDVTREEFLSHQWTIANIVQSGPKLHRFLSSVLPDTVPPTKGVGQNVKPQSRDEFMADVFEGAEISTMSIRMTPYILSLIEWSDPRNDPIARQFLPLKTAMIKDHLRLQLDSLHEKADSPVNGLVHRYPDKVLFLPVSACPTYCSYCTRSYAVGANTTSVPKKHSLPPVRRRWDEAIGYIEKTRAVQDVAVSGGDTYYLSPEHLRYIGKRLLDIESIRRVRFASKGLAIAPGRFLDDQDGWTDALIEVSRYGRAAGKQVALHTHFNHPDEMTWVTARAAQRLFEAGVTVRNQSVLLRGINDSVPTMARLIRQLTDNNVMPYYVYQCDMVKRVEHLRTPLQVILDLETALRGTIAGFAMPSFIVDLPGGGGKRLACSFSSYDRATGRSVFRAPAVKGGEALYEYWDPEHSLEKAKA